MVLLTEIKGTEYGLMGTTVDDVVVRLSEPKLDILDFHVQNGNPLDVLLVSSPEEQLGATRFYHFDDNEYWPNLMDFNEDIQRYTRDAPTDPFHFFQLGRLHKAGGTHAMAAVAIYREWGLPDPRQGEYFKWHKEKEGIRQTVEKGVEAVFDYVAGCIFSGTLEAEYDATEQIRNYIARLKQEVLKQEGDQQKWRAMIDVSTRIGPKNKKQEFWPHFKYIHRVLSEKNYDSSPRP